MRQSRLNLGYKSVSHAHALINTLFWHGARLLMGMPNLLEMVSVVMTIRKTSTIIL